MDKSIIFLNLFPFLLWQKVSYVWLLIFTISQVIILVKINLVEMNLTQSISSHGTKHQKTTSYATAAGGNFIPKDPAPVILKLTSSNSARVNTRSFQVSEMIAFRKIIVDTVSDILSSKSLKGGDYIVYPANSEQQQLLLKINKLGVYNISASLPLSAGIKGIIRDIPVSFSEEDILEALHEQGVTMVVRLTQKVNNSSQDMEKVKLFFNKATLPSKVFIAGTSYNVTLSVDSPFRCRKCLRLGHPTGKCDQPQQACVKCCRHHEPNSTCKTWCINCSANDHQADSNQCPEFVRRKKILLYKAVNGGSMEDAAAVIDASTPALRRLPALRSVQLQQQSSAEALPTMLSAEEYVKMQRRLDKVEKELATLKSTTTVVGARVTEAIKVATEAKNTAANTEKRIIKKHSAVKHLLSQLTNFHLKEATLMRRGFGSIIGNVASETNPKEPPTNFPLELLCDPSMTEEKEEDSVVDETWSSDSYDEEMAEDSGDNSTRLAPHANNGFE